MRVLVCGGRKFSDRRLLFDTMDGLALLWDIDLVGSGAAPGADLMAEWWAREREIDYQGFPARWRKDGRYRAGPIRNRRMFLAFRPDRVVGFPGGTGTADMLKIAREDMPREWVLEIKR